MEINKGLRIINLLIDWLVIYVIHLLIGFLFGWQFDTVFVIVYLFYYFLMEFFMNQTIAKMITKTMVVDMTNSKPSFGKILLRTIFRLNPFDAFSYLFGQEQGGYDLLSKTRLKKN